MEHLEHRQKVTIMIAIMAAMLFAALNQTIVGTALPVIVADIGGVDYFSWVFTIYMLTTSLTAILVGKLSDTYGRKPFILVGIGVFIVGALLCGTSVNIYQLIIYRGIQGFGGGMIMSTAFTAIGDLFPPRERGRWQGLMASVFGLSSVFGPTLGGYIVDTFKWNWVFWVFLPFGIVAFIMIYKMFPNIKSDEKTTVDYLGAIILASTITPLLLAFSWAGETYAWDSAVIIGLFSWSVVALSVFVYVEQRAKNPVIPLHLFKNSIFTISNVSGLLMGMGMFGAIMYMPFFIQGVMGISATKSGFVMMSMMLSMVITSTVGGQLITKTGRYKVFAIAGLLIMGIGMFSMSQMNVDTTLIGAVRNLMIVGLGLGLSFPVLTLTVQNAVDYKYLGVATSASQFFRQAGGTIGVSIMGAIMNRIMTNEMQSLSISSGQTSQLDTVKAIEDPQVLMDPDKINQIKETVPNEMLPVFNQVIDKVQIVLSTALGGSFLFGTFVLGVALVLILFLKEIPLRMTNKTDEESANENTHEGNVQESEATV
ncbi:DHA2 family efflux MFS transporter permease subunit [Pontibacillus yanchengensis]|uniref:DHA2 family efflux MFS transporter permease subunit n=1 Tax=Pontibacillus yanchengensis TaxID=462910 RepID=A0A6I5A1J9_9BACI|nr:DHA2 family efflux MFS transporter permease subunit [Pontibacillus yanchengensis]